MIHSQKTCWIVTNSNAGVLNQALGLADALRLKTEIKHVQRIFPFSLIPPIMKTLGKLSINFTTANSTKLEEPWPDLVIACGAQSVHFCLYIREQSKGKTFCIFLQDPKIPADNFDLIIKMKHDSITGSNVIESNLSLNRITPEKLKQEEDKYKSYFKSYQKPFFTILIGGSTKRYKMTNQACEDIILQIKKIISQSPQATLLITPSRRTPPYLLELLQKHFQKNPQIYIHSLASKENPYFAMLAKAEKIFVTNDSVNMVSEACSTGKKVYILNLLGFTKGKPFTFYSNVIKSKLAQKFEGKIDMKPSITKTTNETQNIAQKVKSLLIKKKLFTENDFRS